MRLLIFIMLFSIQDTTDIDTTLIIESDTVKVENMSAMDRLRSKIKNLEDKMGIKKDKTEYYNKCK